MRRIVHKRNGRRPPVLAWRVRPPACGALNAALRNHVGFVVALRDGLHVPPQKTGAG